MFVREQWPLFWGLSYKKENNDMVERVSQIGNTFGKDGHLSVVSRGSKDCGSHKSYIVKCNICAKSPELFGKAEFDVLLCNLQAGQVPCGCSKFPKWTEEQRLAQINVMCKEKEYEFRGYVDDGASGHYRKLKLYCKKHNNTWDTTNLKTFLKGTGCRKCTTDKLKENYLSSFLEDVEKFKNSGNYCEGTIFERLTNGSDSEVEFWKIFCPICNEDDYSRKGGFSSWFKISKGNIHAGRVPCRCCKNVKWTGEQREFNISSILQKEENYLAFAGWIDCYRNNKSSFKLACPLHGEQVTTVTSFLDTGKRCSGCTVGGYSVKEGAYLYIFKAESRVDTFTGFGITNSIDARMKVHKINLKNSGYKIEEITILPGDGKSILDTETLIKRKFPHNKQDILNFKREATFGNLYNEVVEYSRKQLFLKIKDSK